MSIGSWHGKVRKILLLKQSRPKIILLYYVPNTKTEKELLRLLNFVSLRLERSAVGGA